MLKYFRNMAFIVGIGLTFPVAAQGEWIAYYAATSVPFLASVATQLTLLRIFPKERSPILNEVASKAFTPISAALAMPLLDPVGSSFRQWLFIQVNRLGAIGGGPFETKWYETHESYSSNAQSSRSLYATVTSRVSTNANRARGAVVSGDVKYAVDQIAELAVCLRNMFAEFRPDDHFIAMTMELQFTRSAKIDPSFKKQVWTAIVKYDPELSKSSGARRYYRLLLLKWFG
jgi:hypothetical protein